MSTLQLSDYLDEGETILDAFLRILDDHRCCIAAGYAAMLLEALVHDVADKIRNSEELSHLIDQGPQS